MYAVIETGGKQYRVEVGTELEVELLDAEAGQSITLDRVLLIADGEEAAVGQPVVTNATVAADVVRQVRGEKVISFKYRPKARRRVKKGHRQELTLLRISDIVFGDRSAAADVKAREATERSERQRVEEAARRQAADDAALAAKLAASAPAKPARGSRKAEAEEKRPSKASGTATSRTTARDPGTAKRSDTAKGASKTRSGDAAAPKAKGGDAARTRPATAKPAADKSTDKRTDKRTGPAEPSDETTATGDESSGDRKDG